MCTLQLFSINRLVRFPPISMVYANLQQFKTKTILVTFIRQTKISRTTICFSANLVFPVELYKKKKICKQYARDNNHCLKNRSTEAGIIH